MNKEGFITALARDPRLGSPERARDALDAVLEGITRVTAAGNIVGLNDWGNFIPVSREVRTVRNPTTGVERTLAARTDVIFKPSKRLRRIVNGEEPAPAPRGQS